MLDNALPTIHRFSSGYYLIKGLHVEPSETITAPAIHKSLYTHLKRVDDGEWRTPVLFRHNDSSNHFRVHPDDGVRVDTVEVSVEFADVMDLDRFADEEPLLVAKPHYARMLYQLFTISTP